MATSLTHKYIPRVEQTEQNLFIEEYYSSTDTKILIDNDEQTEISYINYSLQEQLKPIYGYSSRTFDDVAVGNRIVTGTLKVSIKNPEAQSSFNTVIRRSKESEIEEYNNNQQNLAETMEWLTVNQELPSANEEFVDNTTFSYLTKLIVLGYDLANNSSMNDFISELKKFQESIPGLEVTGELDSFTVAEIDKLVLNSGKDIISIPDGTKLYNGPDTTFGYSTILDSQNVTVLNDYSYDNGWMHIMTADGQEGYINLSSVII